MKPIFQAKNMFQRRPVWQSQQQAVIQVALLLPGLPLNIIKVSFSLYTRLVFETLSCLSLQILAIILIWHRGILDVLLLDFQSLQSTYVYYVHQLSNNPVRYIIMNYPHIACCGKEVERLSWEHTCRASPILRQSEAATFSSRSRIVQVAPVLIAAHAETSWDSSYMNST